MPPADTDGYAIAGPQGPELRVVHGRTFDGVSFQIALDYDRDREVAQGATARIYKGELVSGDRLVVAVKAFGEMMGRVQRELRAARQVSLRHPLIIAFLGTAYIGEQTAIVSLYMRNGNLLEYMKANPGCNKKQLIVQVAEAVNYLHTVEKLAHGDLKCTNVLVSDYGEALLADFGLSTFLERPQEFQTTMTAIRRMNTAHFAAPELFLGTSDSDHPPSKNCESDVYAFGMLILEAVTERPPWNRVNDVGIVHRVSSGRHPSQPKAEGEFVSLSHAWWEICRECWTFEPNRRPKMQAVLRRMKVTELHPREKQAVFSGKPPDPVDVAHLNYVFRMCSWGSVAGSVSTYLLVYQMQRHEVTRVDGGRRRRVALL
ncbi:kinase-like protein [Auricularia subglabra TFB-10046 SS5]|nr:kinase-like protein [Auricularia subglabra TFB-10046 SS5]